MTVRLIGAAAPVILLVLLIALFASTKGGLDLEAPVPVESLTIERVVLEPGVITVQVRNTGPEEITIALVNINDSTWPATASPSNVIPRLGTASITLYYPWVEGEAYEIAIVSSNAVIFHASIPVAFTTPVPTVASVSSFALIGVYVGLLPIAIGMMWLPVMRLASRHTMLFLISLTAGVLVVLGVETLGEAFEQASVVPGPFQGLMLVGLGAVGAFALLGAITFQQEHVESRVEGRRWRLAFLIALGIGLHNLGEGLAIGAAYAIGEIALGAFLVIGFILQNVTEGIAIVVPILAGNTPLRQLALLAVIGGAPAIAGTLIGAFTYSVPFAALFLAIGAGAIFQVLVQVGRIGARDAERLGAPFVAFAGLVLGMLALYVSGVLIK